MKVLIFLAAWKRPEITEICFMGISRLRKNSRLTIETLVVISEESMIPLCNKYDIRWTFYKNDPLGEKKNHGLNEAMKLEWDYLVEIGSDDILKDELLDLYYPLMMEGRSFFGTKDAVVINSENGSCIRLRSDTPYGLGRCISRKTLEEVCFGIDVIANEPIISSKLNIPTGQVGFVRVSQAEELEKLGRIKIVGKPRYKLWRDDINRGLDNSSDYFLMKNGIGHTGVKTNKPLCMDIKSKVNIWAFNDRVGEKYTIEQALEGLSNEEQSMICALWKKRNVVEYADNIQ